MTPEEVARDAAAFVARMLADMCEGCGIDASTSFGGGYRPTDAANLCGDCMAAWRASDEGRAWDHDNSLAVAAQRDAEGRR